MTDIDQAKIGEFVERALGVLVGAGTARQRTSATAWACTAGSPRVEPRHRTSSPPAPAARSGTWPSGSPSRRQPASSRTTPTAGRYALPPEHAAVLATDDSPAALAGAFEPLAGWHMGVDALAEAFRTGRDIAWGEHDQRVHDGVTRFFGAAYRTRLVSEWVPALGLEAVLRQGAQVADVGCGQGVSSIVLAQAYPRSRSVGVDHHGPSVEQARKSAASAASRPNSLRISIGIAVIPV